MHKELCSQALEEVVVELPRSVNAVRAWSGIDALRRWGWPLVSTVVAAVVGWDLALKYVRGTAMDFFSQLYWWLFIGLVGLLVWSTMKALDRWRWRLALGVVVAIGLVLAVQGTASTFPTAIGISPGKWVDDVVEWMVAHWRGFFRHDLTEALIKVLVPLENRLLQIPWWLFAGVIGLLAWRASGYRVALMSVVSLLFIAVVGLWDPAMSTMAVVGTATFLSVAVAIPVGIAMAKSDRLQALMRPVLDGMQTMPSFVYLIPAIYFLGLGKVPAVLATMVYAMPPAMRLTNLGIRLVSPELVEAARAFGTTPWQLLIKIQFPLARPTIMAGINQTIMMALAMVVIASMVGAGGLGADILAGIMMLEFGKGLMGGIGIVVLAVIIDRISQGFARDPRAQTTP